MDADTFFQLTKQRHPGTAEQHHCTSNGVLRDPPGKNIDSTKADLRGSLESEYTIQILSLLGPCEGSKQQLQRKITVRAGKQAQSSQQVCRSNQMNNLAATGKTWIAFAESHILLTVQS